MHNTKRSAVVRSLALFSCLLVSAAATRAVAAPLTGLYAFGDSLSDLGNTYNVFGGHGADSAVYSVLSYTASPNRYDDGVWSNGPLWVEHLNDQLGLPALARNKGDQPLATGTNFAYGGSTSGTGSLFGVINNLQLQVSNYLSLAGGAASSTGLYTVWSGGNDVINYVQDAEPNTPAGIDALTTTMAANIRTALATLYNAGARHFLAPNLPALGDKPSFVNTLNEAFANDIVTSYNPKLEQTLIDFRTAHPAARLASWDVYTQFNAMLSDPATYGFTDVTHGAFSAAGAYPGTVVADPDSHVFWDTTHPTAPGHAILGQNAYEAITLLGIVPEPSTLTLLAFAFTSISFRTRQRSG